MATDVLTVAPDDGLLIASDLFLWTGIHHLPVVSGERVVGILSQRDLVAFQARCGDSSWKSSPVERAMHAPAETAGPEDSVTEAAARMKEHRIGCLPVTELGKLVGLVTTTDILTAHVDQAMKPKEDFGPSVADAMTRDPVSVRAGDLILDAAAKMREYAIRHLPVVDGENVVIGMLSDRDIRAAVGDPVRALTVEETRVRVETTRVENIMTKRPMTVRATQYCNQVARNLADVSGSAIPVVDDASKLCGMLSYVDLLRALTSAR